MKQRVKFLVSFVLLACMMFTMCMTAHAATAVSGIAVALDKPIAGAPFDWVAYIPNTTQYNRYTATLSATGGGNAITTGVSWYDVTDGKTITDPSTTAVEGHVYYASVYVKANTDYEFTNHNSLPYTFNGTSDTGVSLLSTATKSTIVAVSSPHYTCAKPTLTKYNNAESGTSTTTSYTYNSSVALNASASPNSNRVFDYWHVVNADTGETILRTTNAYKKVTVNCNIKATALYMAGNRIDTAHILDVDAPTVGKTFDYTASENSSYFDIWTDCTLSNFRNGICWYDKTAGTYIDPASGTTAIEGHTYNVDVALKANEDTDFINHNSFVASIGGVDSAYAASIFSGYSKLDYILISADMDVEYDFNGDLFNMVYFNGKEIGKNAVQQQGTAFIENPVAFYWDVPAAAESAGYKVVPKLKIGDGSEKTINPSGSFATGSVIRYLYMFDTTGYNNETNTYALNLYRKTPDGTVETTPSDTAVVSAKYVDSRDIYYHVDTLVNGISVGIDNTTVTADVDQDLEVEYLFYVNPNAMSPYSIVAYYDEESPYAEPEIEVTLSDSNNTGDNIYSYKTGCSALTATGDRTYEAQLILKLKNDGTVIQYDSNILRVQLKDMLTVQLLGQPSDTKAIVGGTATFNVEAVGDGLTYEWYYNDPGSGDYVKAAATTATYSFTMQSGNDGRTVFCKITDEYGNSVTSDFATVTIPDEITVTKHPVDITAPYGERVTIELEATGEGLTYQWYYRTKDGEYKPYSTEQSTSYMLGSGDYRDPLEFYCEITDKYGQVISTKPVTLYTYLLEITQQPKDASASIGKVVSTKVVANGDGLTYVWYVLDPGKTTYVKSSVSGDTYSFKMTAEKDGRKVYCIVTDSYGKSVVSDVATLDTSNVFEIVTEPKDAFVAEGTKATVSVAAVGKDLSYQWMIKEPNADSGDGGEDWYNFGSDSATLQTPSVYDEMWVMCVITNGDGDELTTRKAIIKPGTPLKITAQPQDAGVLNGEKVSTTVKAEGTDLTYTWYIKDQGKTTFTKSSVSGNTYSYYMNEDKTGRQVYCIVKDSLGNSVQTRTATLYSTGPIVIIGQPQNASAPSGKAVSTTVVAEGEELTYEWWYADKSMEYFAKSSITKDTYAFNMTAAKDGRKVYCVVSDKYGNTVTTDTATLTMSSAESVKITTQPADVEVAVGKAATTKVVASGTGLTYTWFVKDPGKDLYVKSSIAKDTYSFTMSAEKDGRKVYCVVTDANGNSVTSNIATLSRTGSVKITTQPQSVTVAEGEKATVQVVATGNGLTYKWYYKNAGDSDFAYTSSFKSNTYTVEMTEARDGRQVYCVVSDANGNSVKSGTATLNMKIDGPVITSQPKSVTVAKGEKATVSLTATGTDLTYEWYYRSKGDDGGFSLTTSFTTNTYTVEMTEARDGRQVFCIVTDKKGNYVASDVATLSMKSSGPVITTQPKSVTVAEGEKASVKVAATGEDLTYKWYYKNKGDSGFTYTSSFTTNTYTVVMSAARDGRQVYCVVTDANGNTVKSDTATLSMKAATTPLKIITQPFGCEQQEGVVASTKIVAQGDGLTYTWYVLDPGKTDYVKSSITKDTYGFTMTESKDGRKVYCVVKDKYGNSVKSNVAEFALAVFD